MAKLKSFCIDFFELEDEEFSREDFKEPALCLFVVLFSFFILRAIMFRG